MATLNELIAERRDLEAEAAKNDGVIEESLEALWDANDAAIEDKVEAWGHHLRERATEVEVIDAEIKRLTERKRARQNEYDRRRAFLLQQMEAIGLPKVDRPLITVAVQNNPPSVRCDLAPEALPEVWRRVVPERIDVDKKAILAAHKRGEALPEGVSVEQTRSLRIR